MAESTKTMYVDLKGPPTDPATTRPAGVFVHEAGPCGHWLYQYLTRKGVDLPRGRAVPDSPPGPRSRAGMRRPSPVYCAAAT